LYLIEHVPTKTGQFLHEFSHCLIVLLLNCWLSCLSCLSWLSWLS